MARRIAQFLLAALLAGLSGLATAAATPVDLFDTPGVPGTGGNTFLEGPCYCTLPAHVSPVMLLQPGTYDFGEVRDYWVESGATPDGGPDQPNLYVLFDPVYVSGTYPDDFFPTPPYVFPALASCDPSDAACNATYAGAYVDIPLIYTVSAGQDAAQLELIGNYQYTSPLPEPSPGGLLLAGLVLAAGFSATRRRAAVSLVPRTASSSP